MPWGLRGLSLIATWLLSSAATSQTSAPPRPDTAAANDLYGLWTGEYDLTEEVLVADLDSAPLLAGGAVRRVQAVVRPVTVESLGTHVLYLEEYSYDDPLGVRRQVLLALEPAPHGTDADVRVRQYTRNTGVSVATPESAPHEALETLPGCDLWLLRDGKQFRGGTRGRACLVVPARQPSYIDYQLVIGQNLVWYRRRTLDLATDDLLEEVAGFRYFYLEQARLYSCRISWPADGARRVIQTLDVHDQGGRARFRTPDEREFEIALHGQDWPVSATRASVLLVLNRVPVAAEPVASSWASSATAEIGLDLGWIGIQCSPVVTATSEDAS